MTDRDPLSPVPSSPLDSVPASLVAAAGESCIGDSEAMERRRTVGDGRMQPPILKGHDGGGEDQYDGEALANEVFDLIRRRLPRLDSEDPFRPVFCQWLPELGDALGRPRLLPVASRQAR